MRKLVVVGNGMAAVRLLEELLRLAPGLYDITVFGEEPHLPYNRVLLSPVLAGEQGLEDIVLRDAAWYARQGIRLHLGKPVTRIDRVRRQVYGDGQSLAHYDRLVLATGSRPLLLPVAGKELVGILTYRDLNDTQALIESAARFRHAVVIGGGLLGLEAAHGLKQRGMAVTVVHLCDRLMERQLDATAARLLKTALEKKGLRFLLGKRTEHFLERDGRVAGVRFSDGQEIAADVVVVAVGVRPNIELAQAAGLYCERGIVVNDTLQTFDPRIYAVGECVSHRGQGYGLVAPALEMARVCASHLAQRGVSRYPGAHSAAQLKITGIEVFSAGEFQGGGKDTEELVLRDFAQGVYKKLVLRGGKLVGGVLYGDSANAPWYMELMRSGRDVAALRETLLFGPEATAAYGT